MTKIDEISILELNPLDMDKYANKPAGEQERKPTSMRGEKGGEVPATCIYSLHVRGFRKELKKEEILESPHTPE